MEGWIEDYARRQYCSFSTPPAASGYQDLHNWSQCSDSGTGAPCSEWILYHRSKVWWTVVQQKSASAGGSWRKMIGTLTIQHIVEVSEYMCTYSWYIVVMSPRLTPILLPSKLWLSSSAATNPGSDTSSGISTSCQIECIQRLMYVTSTNYWLAVQNEPSERSDIVERTTLTALCQPCAPAMCAGHVCRPSSSGICE